MRRFQSPSAVSTGFTLIELLMVMVVMVIIATAITFIGTSALRREELNSISVGLAGWLESVQRASRRLSPSGCQVVFNPGTLTSHSAIATVSAVDPVASPAADACGVPTEFRLPSTIHDHNLQVNLDSGGDRIVFTPRGTTTALSPLVIRVRRSTGGSARCVRISPILGLVAIGTDPDGTATTCPEASYDEAT